MAEGAKDGVKVGDINVTSVEQAKNYEAQGFLTPEETEKAKAQLQTTTPVEPQKGFVEKLKGILKF